MIQSATTAAALSGGVGTVAAALVDGGTTGNIVAGGGTALVVSGLLWKLLQRSDVRDDTADKRIEQLLDRLLTAEVQRAELAVELRIIREQLAKHQN